MHGQRKNKPQQTQRFFSWRKPWFGFWLGLLGMSFGLAGCESEDRFKVPEHKQKQSKYKTLYQVQGKVKLPFQLPYWTDMSEKSVMRMVRPEPVRFRGELWLRENGGVVHSVYFQRNNHIAMRENLPYLDSVAKFLRLWLNQPFQKRLHVVLVPESDPADKSVVFTKKRLLLPEFPEPRIVVYTGPDSYPVLTKYGVLGEIVEKTARYLLTGSLKADRTRFWRSMVIPYYIRLRGIGGMIDKSYDVTSRPRFQSILRKAGRPSLQEVQGLSRLAQAGKLEPLAEGRTLDVLASWCGFLEDAYGRGAFAAILRESVKHPKEPLSVAVKRVIGVDEKALWKLWKGYYYNDVWRLLVDAQIQ